MFTAFGVRGAVAAPGQPVITVSDDETRVIARYGFVEDVERQNKLAVKELSFLLKKYPDAKEWAVAYNTAPKLEWRVLEYKIESRQLIDNELTSKNNSRRWKYGYFPAHIHRASQESLSIEALWQIIQRSRP